MYRNKVNPSININVPRVPKICIGFFPNLEINVTVNKSKKPFINLRVSLWYKCYFGTFV